MVRATMERQTTRTTKSRAKPGSTFPGRVHCGCARSSRCPNHVRTLRTASPRCGICRGSGQVQCEQVQYGPFDVSVERPPRLTRAASGNRPVRRGDGAGLDHHDRSSRDGCCESPMGGRRRRVGDCSRRPGRIRFRGRSSGCRGQWGKIARGGDHCRLAPRPPKSPTNRGFERPRTDVDDCRCRRPTGRIQGFGVSGSLFLAPALNSAPKDPIPCHRSRHTCGIFVPYTERLYER